MASVYLLFILITVGIGVFQISTGFVNIDFIIIGKTIIVAVFGLQSDQVADLLLVLLAEPLFMGKKGALIF